MADLTAHSYLIFGATGSIGSAVVSRLLGQGDRVFAVGRKAKFVHPSEGHPRLTYIPIEQASFVSINACFEMAVANGPLQGVVNCIGSLLLKPAYLTQELEWQTVIETNLTTAFAVVKAASCFMQQGGSVVLMSSAASKVGLANHEAIAAAKAGINGLVLSAAATYANRNLRFNAVAPGLVATSMTQSLTQNPINLAASIASHPLGRIGQASEVASLITWLLDPSNSWITGQTILLDGGLAQVRCRMTHSSSKKFEE